MVKIEYTVRATVNGREVYRRQTGDVNAASLFVIDAEYAAKQDIEPLHFIQEVELSTDSPRYEGLKND